MEWICPVCGAALHPDGGSYRCENRHCFDRAKSGYVNLLPPSPAARRHGDDRRMVQARTQFLSRGYYAHLMQAVSALCAELTADTPMLVDAGCGEGAYTKHVYDTLTAQGKAPQIAGIDISTDALRHAAKLLPEAHFCAASTAHMPLASESADVILNIFSPFMAAEFRRVLRCGGYLVRVVPMARHLWELKAAVYDTPYENPPTPLPAEGFTVIRQLEVRKTIVLESQDDIQALFQMTPYYYKTGEKDQRKLDRVERLSVTTEFEIAVYQAIAAG